MPAFWLRSTWAAVDLGLGGLQRRDRPGQRRADVVEVVLGRVDLAVDRVLLGLVAVDGAVERLRAGGRREGHDEAAQIRAARAVVRRGRQRTSLCYHE